MQGYSLLVLSISAVTVASYEVDLDLSDFACLRNETKTKTALPHQFLDEFEYSIEIRDLIAATTDYASGISFNKAKSSAVEVHRVKDAELPEAKDKPVFYSFAFNETGYAQFITNKTKCNLVDFDGRWVSTNPFQQPQIVLNISITNQTWKSLDDIYNWANASAQWSFIEKIEQSNETSSAGVPDHQLWSGCVEKPTDDKGDPHFVEVRIGYLPADSSYSYPSMPGKTIVPLFARVIVYSVKGDTVKVLNDLTYAFTRYSPIHHQKAKDAYTLPPPGVFCPGSLVKAPPTTPDLSDDAFTAEIEYEDEKNKKVFTEKIYYSNTKSRQLFAFTFDEETSDIGFVGNLGLKDIKRGFVLHDFDYGVQYVLDKQRSTCLSVGKLPATAGDVSDAKKMDLLRPTELLLRASASNYTYAGQIPMSAFGKANVFKHSAKGAKDSVTVHEAFFSVPADKQENAQLLDLNVYTWPKLALGERATKTRMHFFNQQPVDGALKWQQLDIGPCAKIAESSYFMIEISNYGAASIGVNGPTALKEAIVEQLATHANISALRIPMSQIYVKNVSTPDAPNRANLLFEIAEPSGVQAAEDAQFMPEISSSDAVNNLNDTLQSGDIDIKLSDKVTLKVQKESLQSIPTDFTPPLPPPPPPPAPRPTGGGGGSMAALAICMLIVGIVFGVVGGWWFWKRNRGIAYQIYE